jgi:KaiC/GvpD/RAD55 family RecA-like ATPase
VTVLSGLTGSGKTELAKQIVVANAQAGVPCAYVALEPKPYEVARRTKFQVLAHA